MRRRRRWVLLAILLVVTGVLLVLQVLKVLGGVVGFAEYLIVVALVLILFGAVLLRRSD
jgi:hypothetical protein